MSLVSDVEIARYGPCYIPPPPGYGGNGSAPLAVPNAVPPPPPNSPVLDNSTVHLPVETTLTPVSTSPGQLPPGVEGPDGIRTVRDLITGAPVDSTSTLSPISTTMSPEYNDCMSKCITTAEYNPQCGTDGQDYSNPGRVQCAKGCGKGE